MSQEDIRLFLKKNRPGWFNTRQISKALNCSGSSVSLCISRMRKYKEIKEKPVRLKFKNHSKDVLFFSFKR